MLVALMFERFAIVFIILLSNLQRGEHSLLSRFKSNNQYIAADVDDPDDIDDQTYKELVEELPELRYMLPFRKNISWMDNLRQDRRYLPYLTTRARPILDPGPEDESNDDEDDEESTTLEYNLTSTIMPFITRWPRPQNTSEWFNASGKGLRKFFDLNLYNLLHFTGIYKATCYLCYGDYDRLGLPKSTLCKDAWESDNWRKRTLARYFRAKCYTNKINTFTYSRPVEYTKMSQFKRYYDRGLKKEYYGPTIIKGCYKRFLDVGNAYTQRGCRKWLPDTYPRGFATHRYRRLEFMLGKKNQDACIFSPHASLTPFHRDISLFARYHVCVCSTRYCNDAVHSCNTVLVIMLVVFRLFIVELYF